MNKGDFPLMYSCVFWCEFIDLVSVLAVIVWHSLLRSKRVRASSSRTSRRELPLSLSRNDSIGNACYAVYFIISRHQYFITHTMSQRSLVTRHRLPCEKVNLYNTLVTWTWDACGVKCSLVAGCCEAVPKQKKCDPVETPPHPSYKVPFVLCRSNAAPQSILKTCIA